MARILAKESMKSIISQSLNSMCFLGRMIRDGDRSGQWQWPLKPRT